jgi:hypothetical protein
VFDPVQKAVKLSSLDLASMRSEGFAQSRNVLAKALHICDSCLNAVGLHLKTLV